MSDLHPSQDVRPVTEFRAHTSAFLDQIRATKRAVILTQHGRSAAVLLDVEAYEELLGELVSLRDAQAQDGPDAPALPDNSPVSLPDSLGQTLPK